VTSAASTHPQPLHFAGRAAGDVRRARRVAIVLSMAAAGLITLLAVGADTGPVALATGLVFAVLPVPVYLAIARWVDRFEPEPRSMVLFTFFWGATVAVFIALVLNTFGEVVVGLTFGREAGSIYGGSISAPVVEESAKGLALLLIFRRRREEFNGVVDGVVYAMLVGLGFAMSENVLYYSKGAVEHGVEGALMTFVARGILTPFAHPLFTSMTGVGLGIASLATDHKTRVVAPLAGLGAAMGLHSLWNTAAAAGQAGAVYVFLFVPIFILMVILVLIARGREGKLVRRELQPEVEANWLTPTELDMLSSMRARSRMARRVRRTGGRAARRALTHVQESASELAFARDRAQRGLAPATEPADTQRRLAEALTEFRRLSAGGARTAEGGA
jgi:RsiW-degrading membrane proteinase PrsW (M82 family)